MKVCFLVLALSTFDSPIPRLFVVLVEVELIVLIY